MWNHRNHIIFNIVVFLSMASSKTFNLCLVLVKLRKNRKSFQHKFRYQRQHARIKRGGGGWTGFPEPLEYRKAIGFLCNTGPDSLENHDSSEPVFNTEPSLALQRNAI